MDEESVYKLLVSTVREDQIIGLHICYNRPLFKSWIKTMRFILKKYGKYSEYEIRAADLFYLGLQVLY